LYFKDAELAELITNSKLNVNIEDDVNGLSDLKITRYSNLDGSEDGDYANNDFACSSCFTVYSPATVTDVLPSFGADVKFVEITVPGFSEEWIHGGTSPISILPVQLITFKPQCLGENAFIRWITASENNNHYFNIERSVNGVDFVSIAQIQGAGNSSGLIEYSYLDIQKPDGIVYYRLKQVSFDGFSHNYEPVSLNCNAETSPIKVIPNPFKEKISIIGSLPNVTQIDIFNGNGALVYNNARNITNRTELDLNFLAPGIYLLRLTESDGKVYQFKLIRN
jgi:hypothetical protein